ncbi:MAG TPA: 16S rRNA (guanine(527)-N(7))-methyltransferase RsmG [Actinomycetota bacterium]|nr:16S rRNA (guanine(527)-N(7))-methyltransferase RsmG [Actinomycetota bacterium]
MKQASSIPQVIAGAKAMGISLSEEAARRLLRFEDLLRNRAVPLGLLSVGDAPRIHERHVVDSLRAATLFTPADEAAFDLGPGAGLPGLVLAVAVPWCRFVLVEPRRIRIGFLELAVESLGLTNTDIAPVRAEALDGQADVVTARAFAPLPRTWKVASRLLRSDGRLVYFAGLSLRDPVGVAERAAAEGPSPAVVSTRRVLATSPPLVIMTRK